MVKLIEFADKITESWGVGTPLFQLRPWLHAKENMHNLVQDDGRSLRRWTDNSTILLKLGLKPDFNMSRPLDTGGQGALSPIIQRG